MLSRPGVIDGEGKNDSRPRADRVVPHPLHVRRGDGRQDVPLLEARGPAHHQRHLGDARDGDAQPPAPDHELVVLDAHPDAAARDVVLELLVLPRVAVEKRTMSAPRLVAHGVDERLVRVEHRVPLALHHRRDHRLHLGQLLHRVDAAQPQVVRPRR
jgi:hypothetical protein